MDSKLYWDNRYARGGNSGYGSYDEQLTKKLHWLQALSVASISEIGCGDFNFGRNLLTYYPHASYIGSDISRVIIDRNKLNYPGYIFTTEQTFFPADLVLCIDVLFHVLDDKDYQDLLDKLKKYTKYLAVTAYEQETPSRSPHVVIRKFDYKQFGEPVIRQVVEEDGQLYFYLFKK